MIIDLIGLFFYSEFLMIIIQMLLMLRVDLLLLLLLELLIVHESILKIDTILNHKANYLLETLNHEINFTLIIIFSIRLLCTL